MNVRTIKMLTFNTLEFQTLERVEPSIRIGFPTDEIDDARRANDKRREQELKREWGGRVLRNVCLTRQEWDANAIHDAWEALVTVEAVLEAQSDRTYWERALLVEQPTPDEEVARPAGGVGLVAPGTDVCGMLAETRGAQLREAREALRVLSIATDVVGPRPEPPVNVKYEGV